jgi:hypothetical protein
MREVAEGDRREDGQWMRSNVVANSQYRNAVASGLRYSVIRSSGNADPTLPRFGTDCLPLD